MSSPPSPSASKNAQPEPIVSGSHFLPARPELWVNLMPAAAVTSVNRMGSSAAGSREIATAADKRIGNVVVNRLPFIIVLGAQEAGPRGERLRRFVRLEAQEQLLLALG